MSDSDLSSLWHVSRRCDLIFLDLSQRISSSATSAGMIGGLVPNCETDCLHAEWLDYRAPLADILQMFA